MSNLMFNLAIGYGIFAITTGITVYFTVYRPILLQIGSMEEFDDICIFELCAPVQTALIIIICNIILAPLMFKTALTGPSQKFVDSYVGTIINIDDDED